MLLVFFFRRAVIPRFITHRVLIYLVGLRCFSTYCLQLPKAVGRHASGSCRFVATKKGPSRPSKIFIDPIICELRVGYTLFSNVHDETRENLKRNGGHIDYHKSRAHQAICDIRGYREKNMRRFRTRDTQAKIFKATREGLKYTAILK